MKQILKIYGITAAISVLGCAAVGIGLGWTALVTTLVLSVLEISLSFDNAVVNAKVLKTMSAAWQRAFLTVGILIAVFGVRVLLPISLVAIFAHLSFAHVFDLILHHPAEYGEILHHIHPEIAAFGGIFLLMLFLDYFFQNRPILWLHPVEKRLARLGDLDRIEIVISLVALAALVLVVPEEQSASVLISGLVGLALYLAIKAVGDYFEKGDIATKAAQAGLVGFIYLEVLDASFSLDGVLGAFAITGNVAVITVGLGIGALWVRSMTIHLVRSDTLARYRYLEHGAHYAIGILAVLLLFSVGQEIPDWITGLLGFVVIAAALIDSIRHNRRQ